MLSKEWLRDFGATLVAQDAQPGFRKRVAAIAAAAPAPAPGAVGLGMGVEEGDGGMSGRGACILLFVKDNHASRCAFRLVRGLLRQAGDTVVLVHVIGARASVDEGKAVLAAFTDVMVGAGQEPLGHWLLFMLHA